MFKKLYKKHLWRKIDNKIETFAASKGIVDKELSYLFRLRYEVWIYNTFGPHKDFKSWSKDYCNHTNLEAFYNMFGASNKRSFLYFRVRNPSYNRRCL